MKIKVFSSSWVGEFTQEDIARHKWMERYERRRKRESMRKKRLWVHIFGRKLYIEESEVPLFKEFEIHEEY